MSTLNVDKVDPNTGTALELGTSGDTITVPTGAGLTVVDEVKTNKISPATGTAFTLGDSGDTFTVPSGVTIANSGTATGFGITQTSFLPNSQSMIINGDMQVNQRATSSTSISSGDDGYHTADRWYFTTANQSSVWTQTTEALTSGDAVEDGFSKSLKMDVTTADASPTASARLNLRYSFEGQDVQLIKKGTASAEKITVAFWIKATKTGTNILELYDESTTNRHCSAAYTVSSTNTWEHKIVTFPADTGGTVLANTNAQTLDLYFWVAAGSNYTSGTLQTTWINYASGSTRDDRAVGQVNNADSTSNNFEITGVQLEVGEYTSSTIPPFQHESYGDNKRRCQRYYETSFIDGQIPGTSVSGGNSGLNTSWADGNCPLPGGGKFKVSKRATPTVVLYARGSTTTGQLTSSGTARTAVATQIGTEGVEYCDITSGTASAYSGGSWTASAELT